MGRYTTGGVGRDILAGAAAGMVAVWIADKLDQAIYQAGGAEGIRKTEAARPGGMDPAHVLAKRAADATGVTLSDPKDNAAGHTIHYGIAASMGALYGLLRGMAPAVTTGRGALYGVGMFVVQDEIGNTVLGTAGHPLDYPVRDHARGAVVHTLFGFVTDLGTRLLSPWRDEVVIEQGPPMAERVQQGRAYLQDRGRQALEQGRFYADQGRQYAGQAAGRAQGVAAQVRSRAAEVDPREVVRTGRQQAGRLAETARSYVPEAASSGLSRALDRLFG